jgi:hypothetical protein
MMEGLEGAVSKEPNQPCLILGHPRSGTNYTATVVKSHSATSLLTEPFSLHNGYIRKHFCRYWGEESFDPEFSHKGLIEYPLSVQYFKEFANWALSAEDNLRIFKETTFLLKLPWLARYLPTLNIVYLHRDPKGIVSSFKKAGLYERWGYQNLYYSLCEEVRRQDALSGYQQLVSATTVDDWMDVLTTMYHIRTHQARINLRRFRHLVVSYEDLVGDPSSTVRRILEFVSLPFQDEVSQAIDQRTQETRGGIFSSYQWREVLTEKEQGFIDAKMERMENS